MSDRRGQVWKLDVEGTVLLIVEKSKPPSINWWATVNLVTGRYENTSLHEGMLEGDADGHNHTWRRIT